MFSISKQFFNPVPFMRKHLILAFSFFISVLLISCSGSTANGSKKDKPGLDSEEELIKESPYVDSLAYNQKITALANGDTTGLWPVRNQPLPLNDAILPFKRIIAYYGNLYSVKMGILGELPPKQMWEKLNSELKAWREADPETPVVPALHYIAVVAQGSAGKDGKYRFRMPENQIDSVLSIAKMQDSTLVFLDIQVALSTIQDELPQLEKYLKMPHVHLGIDPEFSMKDGSPPGKRIGSFDAEEINYCSEYLAKLVQENNLPPKVFVIHRFTQRMVTNYQNIKLHPEVQIVIDMDGWGPPDLKFGTHRHFVYKEPIQFTGFKIFYKNDIKKAPNRLLTPKELLTLKPQPSYIQYQ